MKWYRFRKVDFFPFDTYLVNEGYIYGKNKALRWRFKSTLFYYKDGYEHSLRGTKDLAELKRFLKKNFNKKFVRRVGNEIRASADNLLKVTRRAFQERKSLKQYLNNFYDAYQRMLAVFQVPELAQILVPEKGKALLYQFGLDRDYAARVLAEIEKIYRPKLGKLLGIPQIHALLMLPAEVKEALNKQAFPKDLNKRKSCVILTLNQKTQVYWNKDADRVFYNEYLKYQRRLQKVKNLKGQPAYQGRVRGRAYVAFNEDDFKNVPKNSILICSMTRYTVVPFLKRVKAIITDQGGVTCHAAIISRELRIPTVIDTKQATDIFKTGDLVEVDAEKGVVRRISK